MTTLQFKKMSKKEIIAIIGLGYVGLPLAVNFGRKFKTIGFDKNKKRISELKKFKDKTNELNEHEINNSKHLIFSSQSSALSSASIFIITVPTPINKSNNPDLRPLKEATKIVAKHISNNSVVIIESTVYPGVTEEICVPILERYSNMKYNSDFFCGYSPERINPGDKTKTISKIVKVISGSNKATALRIKKLYSKIITAGVYEASSIRTAEMAKAIENAQRDINIAFINEIAIMCNKLQLRTKDVLDAAKTKWNFLNFEPGLVGGHCISVDPYYLYYSSKKLGHEPKIILSGRNINNNMSNFISNNLVKELSKRIKLINSKVLILGVTFKENCPDVRNSQVIKIIKNLKKKKISVDVNDEIADEETLKSDFNISLIKKLKKNHYDAILIAVKHKVFKKYGLKMVKSLCKKNGFIYDIKNTFNDRTIEMYL